MRRPGKVSCNPLTCGHCLKIRLPRGARTKSRVMARPWPITPYSRWYPARRDHRDDRIDFWAGRPARLHPRTNREPCNRDDLRRGDGRVATDGTVHDSDVRTDWSPLDDNVRCPLQLYAGAGPGIFFAETSNQFGRSTDNGRVGLNALAGANISSPVISRSMPNINSITPNLTSAKRKARRPGLRESIRRATSGRRLSGMYF